MVTFSRIKGEHLQKNENYLEREAGARKKEEKREREITRDRET